MGCTSEFRLMTEFSSFVFQRLGLDVITSESRISLVMIPGIAELPHSGTEQEYDAAAVTQGG
jgi:hypothetical protein